MDGLMKKLTSFVSPAKRLLDLRTLHSLNLTPARREQRSTLLHQGHALNPGGPRLGKPFWPNRGDGGRWTHRETGLSLSVGTTKSVAG